MTQDIITKTLFRVICDSYKWC